ncbi:S-layer homology domain-containing protein [Bacillus sp. 37MA]|uniref:S-layer homology domain-containing protein n=1 Tax=Bacillus sp. 37MA TaxID=1132442 RepID=UPI00036FDB59|nr:S-layer homology domain-containing protein [Bacillus sp. 37MA]
MKKFKRIIAVAAITGALFASAIPSVFAEEQPQPTELPPLETGEGFSPFQDANGTRYANAVYFMWINGIAQGKSETRFGVSEPLKRVDAAMIVGNYGIEGLNQNPKKAPFTDLPQRAVRTVSALYEAGIIRGKTDKLFGSNDTMKRGEAAVILSGLLPSDKKANIKFDDVGDRYREVIQNLVAYGIVQGKTETRFGMDDPLTRGELALMIHRIFEANKPDPDPSLYGELPSSDKDISMTLDKDSYSKSESPKLIITNDNSLNQMFGAEFGIEVMKDGSWYIVPFNKELAFPAIINTLQTGGKYQKSISLKDDTFESPLKAGKYRVVQSFNNNNNNNDVAKWTTTLAAQFTITE